MIDAAAVAKCLGISRRMVYDLARDGRLASYRFGDAVRFAPAGKPVPYRCPATQDMFGGEQPAA